MVEDEITDLLNSEILWQSCYNKHKTIEAVLLPFRNREFSVLWRISGRSHPRRFGFVNDSLSAVLFTSKITQLTQIQLGFSVCSRFGLGLHIRSTSAYVIRFINNNGPFPLLIWRINSGKLQCSLRLECKQDFLAHTQKNSDEFIKNMKNLQEWQKSIESQFLEAKQKAKKRRDASSFFSVFTTNTFQIH